MYQIKIEYRPDHFKTANHRLAARANEHWKAAIAKGLNVFALTDGSVTMMHKNGKTYKATKSVTFR